MLYFFVSTILSVGLQIYMFFLIFKAFERLIFYWLLNIILEYNNYLIRYLIRCLTNIVILEHMIQLVILCHYHEKFALFEFNY